MPRRYRRKRVYRRRLRRRMPKNPASQLKGPKKFKLKAQATVTSDVAGVIKIQLTDDPSGTLDWTSISALFDSYKVHTIKIKYFPYYPNDTSSFTLFSPMFMVFDPDHTTSPLTSVNDAIEYDSLKVKNMYKPWSYTARIPTITSLATATHIQKGGYVDIAGVKTTCGIYGYGTGFNISENYGILLYEFVVSGKDRR